MKRSLFFSLLAAAVLFVIGGSGALAGPPAANPCSTGTLGAPFQTATVSGFTVTGTCNVAFMANVTIAGNLTLSDGSIFNGLIPSTVHVTGNVSVGKGAMAALGYATMTDVVDGNIQANQPLSLYLGFVTVHGNVTSNGGGTPIDTFYNFPIKDNTIDGNLTVHGWSGGWFGLLRNAVGGNIDVANITSINHATDDASCTSTFPNGCPATPGADPDSNEVVSNVVSGNVICHGDSPAIQVGDSGGGPNTAHNKIGECAAAGL